MAHYRIHRMKANPQEHFRWAAHTGGLAIAKPRDYEPQEEIEAQNPYEVWKLLLGGKNALRAGDLLERFDPQRQPETAEIQLPQKSEMWIAKYIGFEPAEWFTPAANATPAEVADEIEASSC